MATLSSTLTVLFASEQLFATDPTGVNIHTSIASPDTLGNVDITDTATSHYTHNVALWIDDVVITDTSALSGSISASNGTATDNKVTQSLIGVFVDDENTRLQEIKFSDLSINITSYGEGVNSKYANNSWGISGQHGGVVSFKNTDITIHTDSANNSGKAYGISLFSHIASFDKDSTINITNTADSNVSAGIQAFSIAKFEGVININSGASTGLELLDSQATDELSGNITITGNYSSIGIDISGEAQSISTTINIKNAEGTGKNRMYGIRVGQNYDYSMGESSYITNISSNITVSSNSTVHGIHLQDDSIVENFTGSIDISTIGGEAYGIFMPDTSSKIGGNMGGIIENIGGSIKVSNEYNSTTYDESKMTAGILANLSAHIKLSEDYDGYELILKSPNISGMVTAEGMLVAVGVHFNYDIFDATSYPPGTQLTMSNKSGIISGEITSHTTDGVNLFGTTGEILTERDTKHYKTNVALRVSNTGVMLGSLDPVSEGNNVVINFGNGAKLSATVGSGDTASLGDAIQFASPTLALNAGKNDSIEIVGDITSIAGWASYEGTGSSSGSINKPDFFTESAPSLQNDSVNNSITSYAQSTSYSSTSDRSATVNLGDIATQNDSIQFIQGKYQVKSDYWFVSEVTVGSHINSQTSSITLTGSTKFVDTNMVNFHVNSTGDYSSITVSAGEILGIQDLNTINVTLNAELMATETFRITLIDGDMLDTLGGTLTVNLFDLIIEDSNAALINDLSSIYVEYDGERVFYADGPVTFDYTGKATDFIIGRNVNAAIPEPSTATLSLLALAAFMARRRRTKA